MPLPGPGGGAESGIGDVGVWGWFLMSVGMVLFLALLVAGTVTLARLLAAGHALRRDDTAPNPGLEEALGSRFARGEMDEVEYRERLAALRGRAPQPSPRR